MNLLKKKKEKRKKKKKKEKRKNKVKEIVIVPLFYKTFFFSTFVSIYSSKFVQNHDELISIYSSNLFSEFLFTPWNFPNPARFGPKSQRNSFSQFPWKRFRALSTRSIFATKRCLWFYSQGLLRKNQKKKQKAKRQKAKSQKSRQKKPKAKAKISKSQGKMPIQPKPNFPKAQSQIESSISHKRKSCKEKSQSQKPIQPKPKPIAQNSPKCQCFYNMPQELQSQSQKQKPKAKSQSQSQSQSQIQSQKPKPKSKPKFPNPNPNPNSVKAKIFPKLTKLPNLL